MHAFVIWLNLNININTYISSSSDTIWLNMHSFVLRSGECNEASEQDQTIAAPAQWARMTAAAHLWTTLFISTGDSWWV